MTRKRRTQVGPEEPPEVRRLISGHCSATEIETMRSALLRQECPFCGLGGFKMIAGHIATRHKMKRRALSDLLGFTYTETICDPAYSDHCSGAHDGFEGRANPKTKYSYSLAARKKIAAQKRELIAAMGRDFHVAGGKERVRSRNAHRVPKHGTHNEYRRGCRCAPCVEFVRAYGRQWDKANRRIASES